MDFRLSLSVCVCAVHQRREAVKREWDEDPLLLLPQDEKKGRKEGGITRAYHHHHHDDEGFTRE